MWEDVLDFLTSLPTPLAYSLIVLGIIAITIIALKGHLKAKFGKKEIELGADSKPGNDDPILKPPQTVTIYQKRSCGDCILLLMGEREKFEIQMRRESNKILKDQMRFAEQKLIEIQSLLMGNIIDAIHEFARENPSSIDENIQHKLIYGLFKDALVGVKDEIRRSFKDNGFHDMSSSDFTAYTKDRVSVVTSMLNQYVRNMFPNKTNLLSQNQLIDIIKNGNNSLSIIFNDVYTHARETRIESENKIDRLQQEFGLWVDKFIKPSM